MKKENTITKYEIRYGTTVKLVNIVNERTVSTTSEFGVANFIRQHELSRQVINLHCLPLALRGIAMSKPNKHELSATK